MPKAVIENTEVYQLKSDIVGDVFEITVMKPEDAKTEEYSREMFKLLESRNYPSLNFRGKILDDETHFTMVSSLIGKGLKSVFNQ
tara:strand:- start:790 stop:1044 length:255 start_codon:yes stop_codon:yes gene_type:complete